MSTAPTSAQTSGGAEAIGSGRWRIAVPLPSLRLESTSVYVVECDRGLLLIDAGWDSEGGWDVLVAGLATIGASLQDVVAVMVTHVHADHLGLAARVRADSDAQIGLHPADAASLLDEATLPQQLAEARDWVRLVQGVPREAQDELMGEWSRVLHQYLLGAPDLEVVGGYRVHGGRDLRAVHTPGHTPGHVCFIDGVDGAVFTGDHILPDGPTNVSVHPRSTVDPIGEHLRSLEAVDSELILPGHGRPFNDGRRRVGELVARHERRAADVLDAVVHRGARTVWEVATTITWSAPWDELGPAHRRLGLGEVHAHLARWASDGGLKRSVRAGGAVGWIGPEAAR